MAIAFMKIYLAVFFIFYFAALTQAQIIPDLSTTDDFQPSLKAITPTIPVPANAFATNATIGGTKLSANSLPGQVYDTRYTIQQRNQSIIDADIAAYDAQKKNRDELLQQAYNELGVYSIKYNLGIQRSPNTNGFYDAFLQLRNMLEGSEKIDPLKAVWLVEHAADPTLSLNEFNGMFQEGAQMISSIMSQSKVRPNDNLGKVLSIFKYMADTTRIFLPSKEKYIVTKPMLYDFEDFKAEKDVTKVFVSKLLRTGTGQCMSLPLLFYLYAKSFNADVNLAFAPQHSYITFKDNLGNRQNIELTGRMFMSTDFLWQSGFIKAEQVRFGIYLKPITDNETIAYLVTTLALTYVKTFGVDDRVLEMATLAKKHFPNSLTANMILAGYQIERWKNVLRQYDVLHLNEKSLVLDQNALKVRAAKEEAVSHIYKDLGWSDVPDWAYKKWLEGVNNLAARQQHIVKRRQLEQQMKR